MLDAAALAAILDPERKVQGWWVVVCPSCPFNVLSGSHALSCEFAKLPKRKQESITKTLPYTFTGPATLHTAREHNWRLEEWLEARGYGWCRNWLAQEMTTVIQPMQKYVVSEERNHTAALVAAIERIASELL